MPTTTTNFTTLSQIVGAGADWDTPGNIETSNNVYATLNPAPITTYATDQLIGYNLVNKPASGAALQEIRVKIEVKADDSSLSDVTFLAVHLVVASVVKTAVNRAPAGILTNTDTVYTATFTSADLATLGVTISDLSDTGFGAVASFQSTLTDIAMAVPHVDHLSLEYDQAATGTAGLLGQISRCVPDVGRRIF